uniref:Uncharacterized protein n=2 Tax=Picea TaxID=3328 RepID=A0A117NJC1_PICGL|nr:hypothetical protein ABT39_MTgene1152 [Picea glauca]QHR91711.1 hypothetical protein Q903MT_gene5747 [Picea sitchensis]
MHASISIICLIDSHCSAQGKHRGSPVLRLNSLHSPSSTCFGVTSIKSALHAGLLEPYHPSIKNPRRLGLPEVT